MKKKIWKGKNSDDWYHFGVAKGCQFLFGLAKSHPLLWKLHNTAFFLAWLLHSETFENLTWKLNCVASKKFWFDILNGEWIIKYSSTKS